ncbi:MAG: cytochrome b/b6 domain-containing protein [bacterium]|nr:cytochrome b/b6 domain-containing protein [bacterium]
MRKVLSFLLVLSLCIYLPAFGQADNETCLSCHEDTELEGLDHSGATKSMFVAPDTLQLSVHSDQDCVDCHTDLADTDDYPHAEDLGEVDCSGCHEETQEIFDASAHGAALDNPRAPTCASCHNSHYILPASDPNSWTSAKLLPITCSNCHHQQVLTDDPDVKITDSFDRYMRGIHAEGISKGIGSAASCNDCHGMHDLKPASDRKSMVHKMNIPKTCSKCHNDIYIQYERGIHGKALAAGILDSPNCSDCHGEHEILQISNPKSQVNYSRLSDYVCGRCHNDPLLVEKYDLGAERFSSYQDSYHGLAVKGRSAVAATCVSCHKAHDVLPSSNPASSTHRDNLVETCQKCHINANYSFASSYSHNIAEAQYSVLNRWIEVIYIIAIVLIIGAMMLHNGIILVRHMIEKSRKSRGMPTVKRFNGNMVFQHMVLTIAFIVLAVTGFALKYPNAWWVTVLNFIGIFESARSVIHRVSAVLLIYISIHHAVFLLAAKRGREELKAIWFQKTEWKLIIQNLKFHLGMIDEKPQFDRYDYTEKAEYWALVWGTIVMVFTGFVLWFPTAFTAFLPAWVVKVAETVHLYEAWLATLAIVVFHFFFVMFHPEQYPMSFTWLTGDMTVSEVKEHHPIWYKKITEEGKGSDIHEKTEDKPDGPSTPSS